MKQTLRFFSFVTLCLLSQTLSFAQTPGIAGGNAFYAGKWLEIGEQSNGDFGAYSSTIPTGYHQHCAGCSYGNGLAFVYDYGHDGWTVGAPAYMGDYTYPGSPFEGWEIQYGATGTSRAQAFCTGATAGAYTNVGGAGLTGSITGFTDIGGQQIGSWVGSASGGNLKIYQNTEVDTFASWVVVTTKMYNTSAANIDSIYYFRSCDPDNNESWAGSAAFTTENWVDYQNDADHRVQVHATSSTPAPANQYPFALGTKDCRAVALVYEDWPMSSTQNLAPVWAKTFAAGASWYNVATGTPDITDDIAIGLVIKVGTICPGDSNFVSYAYTFNGAANGIDSALPEPTLVVNGFTVTPSVAPNPTSDTFNTCLYPGITTVPVSIINASTGDWTWSTWTWTSSTGLATTTGVTNSINVNALPPYITYTITGTGYTTSCGNAGPCNARTFYLTIHTCNGATVNSTCVGGALDFNAPGDSTGATYVWVGPDSWTTTVATTQSFTINPSVWADTGTYHVIKTVSGTPDTATAVVILYPLPSINASSNSPLCIGGTNTLSLTATPTGTSPAITIYSWTGPSGFTSSLQNPTISSFSSADSGTYYVTATTANGCTETVSTHVALLPPPVAPTVTDPSPYCQDATFIPFTITDVTGTVYWYPTAAGGTGSTTTPIVNTTVPGTYTYYYGQTVGSCISPVDSIKVTVNPLPAAIGGPTAVCATQSITLLEGTGGGTWSSSNTSIATIGTSGILDGITAGTVTITYKLPTTCFITMQVTVHPKPAPPVPQPQTYCSNFIPVAVAVESPIAGYTYTWYGPGLTPGTTTAPTPATPLTPGEITYYVTGTSTFGCVSDSATDVVVIIAQPAPPATTSSSYCQGSTTLPLNYQVDSATGSTLTWYVDSSGGPTLSGAPVPPNGIVTYPSGTKWWVAQTVNGCISNRASVLSTIVYTPAFNIIASKLWVCDFDTLTFSYSGLVPLIDSSYRWQVPPGATIVEGNAGDESIAVTFDSVNGEHYVTLLVGELNKMCTHMDTVQVSVIALPTATAYMNPNVCLGDTTSLSLSDQSATASIFHWFIDGTPLFNSNEVNIVAANSNSGGPYSVSWNDTGIHVITVTTTSSQGCKSAPTYDSVDVHALPNAAFTFKPKSTSTLCLEDSVEFVATYPNENYSYMWLPEHSFNNDNKPYIWGKVEETQSDITLVVTTPFGCVGTSMQQLDPSACCSVLFPNAFTPNGDGHNDVFRPLFNGYHNFHSFRIVNRWGETIFESSNSLPAWDGTFNGVPQDIGTYFYFIEYDCGGNTIEAKGDVTLIR